MKKSTGVILVLIIVLLLGVIGVGGYFFIKGNNDTDKEIGELKNEVANLNKVNQNQAIENNTSIANNNEESSAGESYSNNTSKANTNLTTAELKDLEDYLNKLENNGFVSHNLYSDVNSIDLKMIFYNIGSTDIPQEELEKILNGNEQVTAIYKITMEQIKNDYYQKTGKNISEEEIKSRFKDAKYDEESGSFFLQHGDTSASNVKCVSGYKTADGLYKVILNNAVAYESDGETKARKVKDTLLTVKKEGNSYKFISHVINSYAD